MKCEICGKEFKNRLGLHIKVHNISIQEYYDTYIDNTLSKKYCPICGKENAFLGLTKHYTDHCSRQCKGKDLKVKEKVKDTCLRKYGANNVYASEYGKQKIKETNLQRYGCENPQQNKEIRTKTKKTCLEKYNGLGWGSNILKYRFKQTCEKKYNSSNPWAFGTSNYKKSMQRIYGVENPQQNENIKSKTEHTNLERYGVRNPAQNELIRQKTERKHYRYNGINFDSSWELAVWIYFTDNHIFIEREPVKLLYMDSRNKSHYYFPDFRIYGQLVEVKANWRLQRLYGTKKYECMKNNNIIVWEDKLILPFLKYCENKYNNKFWFNQFILRKDGDEK